jgi:predicted transcriptional regulator
MIEIQKTGNGNQKAASM